MATSCEELTHWKRLWCWEGLGARGEGDDRGWDGWMASLTRWMWVSVNSGSWWWTGRPGVLRLMGLQRVGQDWATDLISDLTIIFITSNHSLAQVNSREGTQLHPATENWINDLLSKPHQSEQDSVSPSVSLSHQEASISLLSLSIIGQTDWKPKSQRTNQSNTWTTVLSNSMKLWATPCRATQDGWVMVESCDKMWSTGEGNGKPLQYSCLENPMNSMNRSLVHQWLIWFRVTIN